MNAAFSLCQSLVVRYTEPDRVEDFTSQGVSLVFTP